MKSKELTGSCSLPSTLMLWHITTQIESQMSFSKIKKIKKKATKPLWTMYKIILELVIDLTLIAKAVKDKAVILTLS